MKGLMEISEKTLVPLSLVGSIFWAIWWAGGLERRVEAHAEEIAMARVERKEENQNYAKILERLSSIEGELKRLHNNK